MNFYQTFLQRVTTLRGTCLINLVHLSFGRHKPLSTLQFLSLDTQAITETWILHMLFTVKQQ